ncbi:hypothetical protein [Hydrogenovibrio halophilus]|uniref:hypothetical protein n=1 Tax=Hydrogenovibrio halophilus TaxID=373391 RepID=UPI0003799117|nr:hypothetical protein [Hydrogenovibrio halophilus]
MAFDQIIGDHRPENLTRLFEAEWVAEQPDYSLLLKPTAILWLVCVPKQPLTPETAGPIYAQLTQLSQWLKDQGLGQHDNLAKIGNQLPYCHLHLVMREPGDECWPHPIWGRSLQAATSQEKARRKETVRRFLSTQSQAKSNRSGCADNHSR